MIKKTIILSVILLVFYGILVYMNNDLHALQGQEADNKYIAEEYIYNTAGIANVIVGSSIARRLNFENNPTIYNLSFGGGSIYDGFEVIKKSRKFPSTIYVEINVLMVPLNQEFVDDLFTPIPYFVKDNFSMFRVDKKPIPLLVKGALSLKQSKKEIQPNLNAPTIKPELIAVHEKTYSEAINEVELDSIESKLKVYVEYFSSKGTRIVFFEMPINFNLTNLKKADQIRLLIETKFSEFDYIKLPEEKYISSDGIHLGKEEANKYKAYFLKSIKL